METYSPFDPRQEAEAKRKRAMAEMLIQQGNAPMRNEVAGGMTVARSPFESIAQVAQNAVGQYQLEQADNQQADLEKRRQEMFGQAISQMGQNPQQAAAVLAQDPRYSEMAAKILQDQIDFGQRERLFDRQIGAQQAMQDRQFNRQADLQRELMKMRVGAGVTTQIVQDPVTGQNIEVPVYSRKPLPPAALKMQIEATENLAAAKSAQDLSNDIINKVSTGNLKIGAAQNILNRGRNMLGASTPESVAFADLQTSLEKLRNDTLRLNKGVQTDGDAQRAMNEVLQSVNDPEVLKSAMARLAAINERAAALQQENVNQIRQNFGVAPMDFEAINALPTAYGQGIVPQQPTMQVPAGATPPLVPQQNDIELLRANGIPEDRIQQYLKAKGM